MLTLLKHTAFDLCHKDVIYLVCWSEISLLCSGNPVYRSALTGGAGLDGVVAAVVRSRRHLVQQHRPVFQ